MKSFLPSNYQPPLDFTNYIIDSPENTNEESLQLDVLYVGAGPAALSSAIKLSDLAKAKGKELQIGIVEKAKQLGGHTLSGALLNPMILKKLFPHTPEEDLPLREKVKKERFYFLTKNKSLPLPIPPGMSNKNNRTASLCEIVRWLGKEAEKRGIYIFTSSTAEKLLMKGNKVAGVKTAPMGWNRDGSKESFFNPGTIIFTKAVVLSEGSRGHLTESWLLKSHTKSRYPQTYALGVKEIWQIKTKCQTVLHTIGWPLSLNTFGGSWLYPLGENLISFGLIAGLDSPEGDLSVHNKLQIMKEHPLFAGFLKGGKCLQWGAKTLPEGGWHALPEKLSGHGVLIIGDSAGFINMATLKGIHYAMASGLFAAETLFEALKENNFSENFLKSYDKKIQNSFIAKELYKCRNIRQSFQKGLITGLLRAGLITVSNGRWPRDFQKDLLKPDNQIQKTLTQASKDISSFSKAEGVYLSGNRTRDQIPSHLKTKDGLPKKLIQFYEKICPAGVYEEKEGRLVVNAPNCVDCKATDILGPRWQPREGGSGPEYQLM